VIVHTESALPVDPSAWRICLVLPTRNEGATLRGVIAGIRAAFSRSGLQEPIILVADDSHDETRAIARELGLHIVIGGGKGLGYAMYQGLKASLDFEPDVIMSMDADGQSDPSEVKKLLDLIAAGEADMVVGSRFLDKGLVRYPYRWINRMGIMSLTWILRWLTGVPLTDSHGGLRAMRPEVVRELEVIGTHTYVQETIIDAHEKGFRIREVPSIWLKREHGGSKVVGSIPKYIMYTLPILIIRSGLHIRWLYSLGFFLVLCAFLYFGFISWQEGFRFKAMFSRLPSFLLIALLIMAGLQLFTFGFLAELTKNVKARVDRLDVGRATGGDRNARRMLREDERPESRTPPMAGGPA